MKFAPLGVSRARLVPPSWEGERNDLALDAASTYPARFAVMGRLALQDPKSRGLNGNTSTQRRKGRKEKRGRKTA